MHRVFHCFDQPGPFVIHAPVKDNFNVMLHIPFQRDFFIGPDDIAVYSGTDISFLVQVTEELLIRTLLLADDGRENCNNT